MWAEEVMPQVIATYGQHLIAPYVVRLGAYS